MDTPRALGCCLFDTAIGACGMAWTECALRLLWESFPSDSWGISSWPRCQQLLLHVLVVCEHAERLQLAGEEIGWLLNQAAIATEIETRWPISSTVGQSELRTAHDRSAAR